MADGVASGAGTESAPRQGWPIGGDLLGDRIDRIVAVTVGVGRSRARALIEAGAVHVDGVMVTKAGERVRDAVRLEVTGAVDAGPVVRADPSVTFEVVHQDEDLVVVDKPAGLVVHPAPGHDQPTLVDGLLARYPDIGELEPADRPGIVHRLDRGTSGLLVAARSAPARDRLAAAIAQREVTRRYRVLVEGRVAADRGLIDAPLGRDPRRPTRRAVVEAGREARTRYEVITRFSTPGQFSFLTAELETGRTHQIRVHLAAIDHPVAGDPAYGGPPLAGLARPFLHAGHLGFTHPVTGASMAFDSPLPPDLVEVLGRLE